jgi:hypothetical protein
MPDADRTVIATRVTASDYAFTAIALNLDWGERHREVVVRCLRAPRDAVRGTASHIDEPPPSWGGRAHSNTGHARRALREMFDRQVSPLDLRINRRAIEAVFDNIHRFGLVGEHVKLSYDICVDDSFLAAA